jgi:hypothetical protein
MAPPVDDQGHQHGEQQKTPVPTPLAEQLDPPPEVKGSLTVDNARRQTPTGVSSVTPPEH